MTITVGDLIFVANFADEPASRRENLTEFGPDGRSGKDGRTSQSKIGSEEASGDRTSWRQVNASSTVPDGDKMTLPGCTERVVAQDFRAHSRLMY